MPPRHLSSHQPQAIKNENSPFEWIQKGGHVSRKADWDRIEQVFNLNRQGISNTEIGKRLGISRSYVWKVIRRQGELFAS
ncbi:helix-turn-helix domain-containing protein [Gluconobacter kondonii]|uniref:helix-turn-helix domain-containing protein n=1 Tax=Gluconobacter kondonii TaxID=941463 RepID=UPI00350E5A30